MSLKSVGSGTVVSQTITRAANTTTYAAGDVVDTTAGAGLTFANVARDNGITGYIADALFIDSANQALKGQFECWLFSAALATYDADNTAFTPTAADMVNLIGVLEFLIPFVGDATAGIVGEVMYHAERTYLPLMFEPAALDDDLFGVIVVRNAYVPLNSQLFTVVLKIDQN